MELNKKRIAWNKGKKGYMGANKTSFKKGQIPWNKGLKGCWGANKTSFKKGDKVWSHKLIGTIRITKHKKEKSPRKFIKIAEPSRWITLALYVWENENGKIPKGMVIHHKDRNPLNDNIENLQIMTRAEHLNEHRHEYDRKKGGQKLKEINELKRIKKRWLLLPDKKQKNIRPEYKKCGIKPENYGI